MILADSSVWIDYLGGSVTPQTDALHGFLGRSEVALGDLNAVEVLQGIRDDREFRAVQRMFAAFPMIPISTPETAATAAANYRILRAKGVTVCKTIDTLIATRCIIDGLPLLFSDRDFEPFVEYLGLVDARDEAKQKAPPLV